MLFDKLFSIDSGVLTEAGNTQAISNINPVVYTPLHVHMKTSSTKAFCGWESIVAYLYKTILTLCKICIKKQSKPHKVYLLLVNINLN